MSNHSLEVVESVDSKNNVTENHKKTEVIPIQTSPLDLPSRDFKNALVRREKNRQTFLQWIADSLVENTDYGRIHIAKNCPDKYNCNNPKHYSKPSMWKPGAEKICGMLGLIPKFPNLAEYERAAFEGKKLVSIILKCQLETTIGFVAAEGVGARNLSKDDGDINKALKMAEKSAHIDACLRVAGLSEIFTQDLEDMYQADKDKKAKTEKANEHTDQRHDDSTDALANDQITDDQIRIIKNLIACEFIENDEKKKTEEWLNESHTSIIAEKMISRLKELIKDRNISNSQSFLSRNSGSLSQPPDDKECFICGGFFPHNDVEIESISADGLPNYICPNCFEANSEIPQITAQNRETLAKIFEYYEFSSEKKEEFIEFCLEETGMKKGREFAEELIQNFTVYLERFDSI